MMKNVLIVLLLLTASSVFAQQNDNETIDVVQVPEKQFIYNITANPGMYVPVGESAQRFGLGGGVDFSAYYKLRRMPIFALHVMGGYHLLPLKVFTSLSVLDAGAGAGINIEIIPRLHLLAFLEGGYYYGFLHNGSGRGGNGFISGRIGSGYRIIPNMSLGLEVGFRSLFGLYTDFKFTVSASYYPKQKIVNTMSVEDVIVEPVYPALYRYYESMPVGRAVLNNLSASDLEKVEVTFFIEGQMEKPRVCDAPAVIGPRGEQIIELRGLFDERILSIQDDTELTFEIFVVHKAEGWKFKQTIEEVIPFNGKQDITGDDAEKLVLYVSSRDLTVQTTAHQIETAIYGKSVKTIHESLQKTIGTYKTLSLFGLKTSSGSPNYRAIDTIQFPLQTLQSKTGSIVDVSLLFCSLMEAMQVETALIPVSGSLLTAVKLEMSEDEIERSFSHVENLIPFEGGVWVPLLLDNLSDTFLTAWNKGAEAYRSSGAPEVIPVRQAWKKYEQTGFAPLEVTLSLPREEPITEAYLSDISEFINWEIAPRVVEFEAEIQNKEDNLEDTIGLGALYGKYGQYQDATEQLDRVLLKQENVDALVNMGNIYFLQEEYRMALPYYERAYTKDPFNPVVLLCMARVNHALENYGNTEFAYEKLMSINSELADRFEYLQFRGEEAALMAEESELNGVVLWLGEE